MACCRSMVQGGLILKNPIPSVVPKGNLPFKGGRHRRRCSSRIAKCCIFSARDFRPQLDEYPEGIISGEWTENFSLLSFDDLCAYLESQVTIDKGPQPWLLGEVMSKTILTTTADRKLNEVNHHFDVISGLPVVDDQLRCVGIISKGDIAKASQGARTKVGEVMSSPAITLSSEKTVMGNHFSHNSEDDQPDIDKDLSQNYCFADAAALMLKMKIHRIPVVNKGGKVLGIVTRTDIWEALEAMEQ